MPFDNPAVEVPVQNADEIALIDKAMALIATPEQWTQGQLYWEGPCGEKRYCAVGALFAADDGFAGTPHSAALRRVHRSLNETADTQLRSVGRGRMGVTDQRFTIQNFNDWSRTKHADVINIMRRVRASFE